MNLPNKLTFLRIILIPFVMGFLIAGQAKPAFTFVALGLFIIACITDFLDGYIARKYNLVTNLGKFMDPVADKLLIILVLLCFVAIGGNSLYNQVWWVLALVVARELSITAFRVIAAERNVVIAANIYGKIKTNVQMFFTIFLMLYKPLLSYSLPEILIDIYEIITWILLVLTAILTVVSFIIYIIQNAKVLKDND